MDRNDGQGRVVRWAAKQAIPEIPSCARTGSSNQSSPIKVGQGDCRVHHAKEGPESASDMRSQRLNDALQEAKDAGFFCGARCCSSVNTPTTANFCYVCVTAIGVSL